jgi:hypothetical protein
MHDCAQEQIHPNTGQSLARFAVPELRTHPWACGPRRLPDRPRWL